MSRPYDVQYISTPDSRGTMICTLCNRPIEGDFRVYKKDKNFDWKFCCQHRACCADDPKWAEFDARKLPPPIPVALQSIAEHFEFEGRDDDAVLVLEASALLSAQAREIERLKEAARAVNSELWWCAVQLGCDWKDADWRAKSSVGRAYDASVAALQTQAGGE